MRMKYNLETEITVGRRDGNRLDEYVDVFLLRCGMMSCMECEVRNSRKEALRNKKNKKELNISSELTIVYGNWARSV